jgi:hypothetical protein
MSVVAFVLAWYGALQAEKHIADSPLRQARGTAGQGAQPNHWYERLWVRAETSVFGDRIDKKTLALTERSKIARYSLEGIAYFLPLVLGVGAALTGGLAMKVIERSGGRYAGNFQSVLSMMLGGFAAVVAGCMILSLYAWRYVPSPYTT